ncbi:hypothetical protein JD844_019640 [Phrynosoma platyrhinos]|uniref:Uncharacterized protein n=1 Tax=Phrynosoma platyrhinos TaxID=52577 RepID=A0ABQ7TQ61_PHRPL|nr:hypothetical protein JD844_019640 [Phrynosoma platyrhinos]
MMGWRRLGYWRSCEVFYFILFYFIPKLKEMAEAEDALSEANALNNNNAEVWAYLALVCMQVSSQSPFSAATSRVEGNWRQNSHISMLSSPLISHRLLLSLQLELDKKDLLQEIREVQQAVGFGDPSF